MSSSLDPDPEEYTNYNIPFNMNNNSLVKSPEWFESIASKDKCNKRKVCVITIHFNQTIS